MLFSAGPSSTSNGRRVPNSLDDAVGRGYWRLLSLRIFKRAVHSRIGNLQRINLSLLTVTSIVIKWFARCECDVLVRRKFKAD